MIAMRKDGYVAAGLHLLFCLTIVECSWGSPRADSYNSGFASSVSPANVQARNWTAELSYYTEFFYGSPAVNEVGNIYVPAGCNTKYTCTSIHSFTSGGELRWTATVQLGAISSLLYSDSEKVLSCSVS